MPEQTRIVAPSPKERCVQTTEGQTLQIPTGWELLSPGDAALTRRVKAGGPSWTVQKKKGRKIFSLGVWAPSDRIQTIRVALKKERSTDAYAKRRKADAARRERKQGEYVEDFRGAVVTFLNFAPGYSELESRLADCVTKHATPVGSGTVARTQRIPIERRAESAVIAWLRHATTAYDNMKIPRVKGKRREVRRMLAEQSRRVLDKYRSGGAFDLEACPLHQAIRLQGE